MASGRPSGPKDGEADAETGTGGSTWPGHVRARLLDRVRSVSSTLRSRPLKPEQVHRARRLLKEANALARLLEDCKGATAKEATRGFARLRHRLGDVRDLDVIEAAFARFAPKVEDALRAAIGDAMAARRLEIDGTARAEDAADMREEVRAVKQSVASWNLDDAEPAALASAARRTYKSLRRRGTLAFDTRRAHDLHELRKPLIVHRYQMEAIERAWPKLFRAWAAEAQNLRDKLGEHHDLMMLAEFAEKCAGDAAAPLLALIVEEQDALVVEAEPIFDRICAEKPAAFERRVRACLTNTKKRLEQPEPDGATAEPEPHASTDA